MAYDTPRPRTIGEYVNREKAKAKLKKSGMLFPQRVEIPEEFLTDNGDLIIPEDVSAFDSEDLIRYLSIFTGLASYYEAIVAVADIDKNTAERVTDYIEAKRLIEISHIGDKGKTVTEMKAERDMDELVLRARDWKDDNGATFKLAEALLKGVDRIIFLLSREITRRGNTQNQGGREYKVKNGYSEYQ